MTPQSDVSLARWCSMGVGGPARWLVEARTESEVCAALDWARARDAAVQVLGGGSNVVIADRGFDGLVVRVDIRAVERTRRDGRVIWMAGAGEPWDPLVESTVAASCAGLECLSGIPGQVGGTPVQNVGAYGQEVSDTIAQVHVVDRDTLAPQALSNAECRFGYRASRFKLEDRDRFVVTRVEFALTEGAAPTIRYADLKAYFAERPEPPTLGAVRQATLAIRRRKGMVIEPDNPARQSCGSFFVNPVITRARLVAIQALTAGEDIPHYPVGTDAVKVPAAWLIERAGFGKGTVRGAVGISPFQAQAIINRGGATADEVLGLAADVKRAVWRAFAIALLPEPVFVGFAESPDLQWLMRIGGDRYPTP